MGNQSTTLAKGNQTTVCSLGSISMEAMQSITLTVGPSSIAIEPSGITINAPMVTVNGDETVIVNGGELLVLNGAMTMIN
jgi:type VI secretion system secreted protein VgrG